MAVKVLDTVVLQRDVPEHSLKKGDLGVVVELYDPDGFEVEFVSASGGTVALVTLKRGEIRPVAGTDILAARSVSVA